MPQLVSFIIPAHNEEALISSTLSAIRDSAAALHLTHEVIVADDASTDATARLAAEGRAQVVSIDRRQIAAARNAGAGRAQGDILIFVDADTKVTTEAVRGALAAIENGAVGGGADIHFDGVLPFWASILAPFFMAVMRFFSVSGGCFIFCTREAFVAAGGWDEELFASEEIALARELKLRGRFVVIREHVITSGRKLRTYSGLEVLWMMLRMSLSPGKSVRSREKLDLSVCPSPDRSGQEMTFRRGEDRRWWYNAGP